MYEAANNTHVNQSVSDNWLVGRLVHSHRKCMIIRRNGCFHTWAPLAMALGLSYPSSFYYTLHQKQKKTLPHSLPIIQSMVQNRGTLEGQVLGSIDPSIPNDPTFCSLSSCSLWAAAELDQEEGSSGGKRSVFTRHNEGVTIECVSRHPLHSHVHPVW